MLYLKLFETEAEQQSCTALNKYLSYTEENDDIELTYAKNYVTFIAKSSGNFKFSGSSATNAISYSTDNGETWSTPSTSVTYNVTSGTKVLWKGKMTPNSKGIGTFSASTASYDLEGNPLLFLFGDDYTEQSDISSFDYPFYYLFSGSKCVNANNLILSAQTLSDNAYRSMFKNCTSLLTAPELPATNLSPNCYLGMFQGCSALTTPPSILPAQVLKSNSYVAMFTDCVSLASAPEILATNFVANSCGTMFSGCTSLTTAPALNAVTVGGSCFLSMFKGCTSLTTAPELPAATLATGCYNSMFSGCTNLNHITMLATNISATNCLSNWVSGVAATGTFVKNASMTTLPSGASGIPNGWTVQDA